MGFLGVHANKSSVFWRYTDYQNGLRTRAYVVLGNRSKTVVKKTLAELNEAMFNDKKEEQIKING